MAAILEQYKEVFQPGLGTLKGYKAKIVVDPNVVRVLGNVYYTKWLGRKNRVNEVEEGCAATEHG